MRKFLTFILVSIFLLTLPWGMIWWQTHTRIYRDIDIVPTHDVGLLLGTSPTVQGQENLYFTTRIEAAKELYERGKIRHILVSGDNSTRGYNEPQYMKNALLSRGIPESAITLDYAGLRTLDSVVRAEKVFSLTDGFIIISQPFHIERALYLADMQGTQAIGYGAANVSLRYGPMVYVREIGARFLALYDGWFGTEPAVLGEKVKIGN